MDVKKDGCIHKYRNCSLEEGDHNSPIYDEYQTQSAWVLTLPWKRAHQDDSNDTPQIISEFQVNFPSTVDFKAYLDLS